MLSYLRLSCRARTRAEHLRGSVGRQRYISGGGATASSYRDRGDDATTNGEPSAALLAYRRWGHLEAAIDPLSRPRPPRPELAVAVEPWVRNVYASSIGAEFEHVDSAEEREWIAQELEAAVPSFQPSLAARRNAWLHMTQAELLELYLARKFPSFKRYSGEGSEALLPAVDALLAAAAAANAGEVVIGMAHRGRLAMACTLLGYSPRHLFRKVTGLDEFSLAQPGLDDVTSHLSTSHVRSYSPGVGVRATLLPNPSHLEAVNPVAAGTVRSVLDAAGKQSALCLTIHGDAAVSGQGIVAELFAMSKLPGYSVSGTIHVVTNNQVGFTSEALTSRSSEYATDFAKIVSAPVFHVGEDIRSVLLVCRIASEYWQRFRKDVVIDLIGFRRHGHNEVDEPAFTNPLLYSRIRSLASLPSRYADALVKEGVLSEATREATKAKVNAFLDAEFAASKTEFTVASGALPSSVSGAVTACCNFGDGWGSMGFPSQMDLQRSPDTGVDSAALQHIGAASVALPEGFQLHDRLLRAHVAPRLAALGLDQASGAGMVATHATLPAAAPGSAAAAAAGWSPALRSIDWSTAEALAFGSLMQAGVSVRLSGQDSSRGTFSQRHAVLVDQATGDRHTPLNAMPGLPSSARFEAHSSLLSEAAVLGFDYGYSIRAPNALVMWEAQFGDFANCAQVIVDAFVSSGESKWLQQSGLVLLLPHGFDGAGPEHVGVPSVCLVSSYMMDFCIPDVYLLIDDRFHQHCALSLSSD